MYACLRALHHRRRLVFAAFLVPFLAALVYAFAATPLYRATARFLVEVRNPRVVTFQEVVTERPRGAAQFHTTQRDMLRSRALARATIERLGLWDHPAFGGTEDSPWRSLLRAASRVPSSILAAILPGSGKRGGNAETRRQSLTTSLLMRNLEIGAGRNSRVVEVTFSAPDPDLAADVANTLAAIYIERDIEFRNESSREASEWLKQRIADQRHNLEMSEKALQRYREDHGAASIQDRQDMIVSELEELHSAVTGATMARIESETRYRELESARDGPEALQQFPGIRENAVIQEQWLTVRNLERERVRLAEEFGPRHPSMIQGELSIREAEEQLRSEIAAVVDALRLEYELAKAKEQQLLAEFDRQTAEALALDRTGIEFGVMQREAESSRQIYESLLLRAAETAVTGELETTNIRMVDEAEPPIAPAWPQRQLILLVGLFAGAVLAVGLALLAEYRGDGAAFRGMSGTAAGS